MRLAWRSAVVLGVGVGIVGCARANPAFDEYLIADGETTKSEASGDGDSSEGNTAEGDGDPTTTTNGDGDGDPTTTGDGDGDPDTTTGDGDGDPDTTSGDGDGDPDTTTGDGDGDDLPVLDVFNPDDLCEQAIVPGLFEPFYLAGTFEVEVDPLPGFTSQGPGCQQLTICAASQESCSPQTPYFFKLTSGQVPTLGLAQNETAIQLHFTPGNPDCGMPPLLLDPDQWVQISFNQNQAQVDIRMPCFDGTDLRLWVAEDGSTFYDPDLSSQASVW